MTYAAYEKLLQAEFSAMKLTPEKSDEMLAAIKEKKPKAQRIGYVRSMEKVILAFAAATAAVFALVFFVLPAIDPGSDPIANPGSTNQSTALPPEDVLSTALTTVTSPETQPQDLNLPLAVKQVKTGYLRDLYPEYPETYWITDRAQLDAHAEKYDLENRCFLDGSPSFLATVEEYDEAFFAQNDLIFVTMDTKYSNMTFEVTKLICRKSDEAGYTYTVQPYISWIDGSGEITPATYHLIIPVNKQYGQAYSGLLTPVMTNETPKPPVLDEYSIPKRVYEVDTAHIKSRYPDYPDYFWITNRAELEAHINKYNLKDVVAWGTDITFPEKTNQFDNAFFENYNLIVITITDTNLGNIYEVPQVICQRIERDGYTYAIQPYIDRQGYHNKCIPVDYHLIIAINKFYGKENSRLLEPVISREGTNYPIEQSRNLTPVTDFESKRDSLINLNEVDPPRIVPEHTGTFGSTSDIAELFDKNVRIQVGIGMQYFDLGGIAWEFDTPRSISYITMSFAKYLPNKLYHKEVFDSWMIAGTNERPFYDKDAILAADGEYFMFVTDSDDYGYFMDRKAVKKHNIALAERLGWTVLDYVDSAEYVATDFGEVTFPVNNNGSYRYYLFVACGNRSEDGTYGADGNISYSEFTLYESAQDPIPDTPDISEFQKLPVEFACQTSYTDMIYRGGMYPNHFTWLSQEEIVKTIYDINYYTLYRIDESRNGCPSFLDAIEKYDESWFNGERFVLVVQCETCGDSAVPPQIHEVNVSQYEYYGDLRWYISGEIDNINPCQEGYQIVEGEIIPNCNLQLMTYFLELPMWVLDMFTPDTYGKIYVEFDFLGDNSEWVHYFPHV